MADDRISVIVWAGGGRGKQQYYTALGSVSSCVGPCRMNLKVKLERQKR